MTWDSMMHRDAPSARRPAKATRSFAVEALHSPDAAASEEKDSSRTMGLSSLRGGWWGRAAAASGGLRDGEWQR